MNVEIKVFHRLTQEAGWPHHPRFTRHLNMRQVPRLNELLWVRPTDDEPLTQCLVRQVDWFEPGSIFDVVLTATVES